MFFNMRQTEHYLSLRMNLKLQYEILSIGLKESMMELVNEKKNSRSKNSIYYYFATFFADDKENLKDIMK